MAYLCNNCGKEALETDVVCWHCGVKLPKQQSTTPQKSDPDADILAEPVSSTAVAVYAGLLIVVFIGLMGVMLLMRERPLFILNDDTRLQSGWTAVTDQNQTFTFNIPADWESLERQNPEQTEQFDEMFTSNERMQTAVTPIAALFPDTRLLMTAVPPDDQPAFVLIAHGDALHKASIRELFTRIGDSQLKENTLNGNIIENAITGEQFDLRLQFPSSDPGGDLRCQHRFIKGGNDSYLLAACAPDREYRGQSAVLFNLLSSFQPLN